MRAFIKQLRLETGLRVCAKVYEEHGDKPSKVILSAYSYSQIIGFNLLNI